MVDAHRGDGVRWRKSSRSGPNGSCVELADTLRLVRDSKNPGGPILAVDARHFVRWAAQI